MSLISKEHLSLTLKTIKNLLSKKADKSELQLNKIELQEEISKVSENIAQSDWNEVDESSKAYILNKPDVALQSDLDAVVDGKMDTTNPVGTGSFSMNRKADTPIGDYSHAEGYDTIASGKYSHAENNNNIACGQGSHAEASGSALSITITGSANATTYTYKFSYAITLNECAIVYKNNVARITSYDHSTKTIIVDKTLSATELDNAPAMIYTASASGVNSHIEGTGTKASGSNSHAEGYNTIASGYYSHAEGTENTASGQSSHVEGQKNTASGKYSHAEGYCAKASGESSHAEGYMAEASGKYSHAEGNNTKASGNYSHAEGSGTASGNYSHAEGSGSYAYGNYSHAEGSGSYAYGNYSHAEGVGSYAYGNYSHAEGDGNRTVLSVTGDANATTYTFHISNNNNDYTGHIIEYNNVATKIVSYDVQTKVATVAKTLSATALNKVSIRVYGSAVLGDSSHSEGESTVAEGNHQHVQGKYNISDVTSAHIVGNGAADTGRSNAHTLDWNGNAWFAGDVYVGSTSGINKDEGSKKLATEEYVDNAINNKIADPFVLTDETTGVKYKLSVIDGKLQMTEVNA